MFRGWFEHAVDTKGRVSIPSHFRDVLAQLGEEQLIITTSISNQSLVAYPVSKWQILEEKVRALPQFDPNVAAFRRLYIAGAMECPVDRQGRVLIPPVLRENAGIVREIVFAGDLDTIQIWAKDVWYQERESDRNNLAAIQKTMANLGL